MRHIPPPPPHQNTLRLRILNLLLLLIFCSAPLLAQTTFQRYFTLPDTTLLGRKIIETSDGNIAVTSVTEVFAPNQQDRLYEGVLTKLTQEGSIVWSLKFLHGPALLVYVDGVEATPDGGMIVLVMSKDDYSNKFHPNIVKISAQGVVEWTKTIPGTTYFYLNGILPVTDGFLISGLNYNTHGTIVFKIDYTGTILWGKNINNILLVANRAAEDLEGNLYLSGGLNINNSALGSVSWPLLVKLDNMGTVLWSKTYTDPLWGSTPITPFQRFRKCLFHEDGLVLFSNNFSAQELVMLQTDLNGVPSVQKRFRMSGATSSFPVLNAFSAEDGHILVGTFDSHLENRPVLMQLTAALEMTWIKSFGKTGVDLYTFSDMQKHGGDEGFLFTGPFYENSLQKIGVVKTDKNGEFAGRCCAREEEVFQGISAVATAADTVLTELPFPAFADGAVYTKLVTVGSFPICAAPASAMIALSDTLVCPGSCIEVTMVGPEQNGVYSWSIPHAMPDTSTAIHPGQVCFGIQGVYPVYLRQEGCLIDSSHLNVEGKPEMFPNAFTPNGDGVNDVFQPIGQCPVEEYRLQVYNRWGAQIFESKSVNEGWNGEVAGVPAPVDVYIYQVAYYSHVNGVRTLLHNAKKEVTLLR